MFSCPIRINFMWHCQTNSVVFPVAVWHQWQVTVAEVMNNLCLSECLSVRLKPTMCSHYTAVNILFPLGWSCERLCVCVDLWICVRASEQAASCPPAEPAMLYRFSAHRALWAVNNTVPQPGDLERSMRGVKTPTRKRKKYLPLGAEIVNHHIGQERGRWS